MQDLGEMTWQDFMKTNPAFKAGQVFLYRYKIPQCDGWAVAVYERFDDQSGAGDICQNGIFWNKELARGFAFQFPAQS